MPLNIDLQQIFLHLLNFTILFAALYFLLYDPIRKFMDQREAWYAEQERQAAEKLAQAEQLRSEHEAKLAQAGEEIRAQKEQAMQEAAREAQSQLQQAKQEASHMISRARAEAQAEHDHALGQARKEIAAMVAEAAGKLIADSTSDAYDQFLAAVKERDGDA